MGKVLVFAVVLWGAAWGLQPRLAALDAARAHDSSFFFSGPPLSLLDAQLKPLAADALWIRTVQALGRLDVQQATAPQKQGLYRAALAVNEVDPSFVFPLEAMGVVLSAWMNEDRLAGKLFLRGQFLAPESWKFPFFLGFLAYFYEGDAGRAANYLRLAALKPGCPVYVSRLVAKLYAFSGRPKEGLSFLDSVMGLESLADYRPQIEKRRKEIVLTAAFQEIQGAIERYRTRFGRPPKNLGVLTALGLLDEIPKDPFGGQFRIDPKTGLVFTTSGATPLKPKEHFKRPGLSPLGGTKNP